MLVDSTHIHIEQLRHQLLAKPNSTLVKAHFDAALTCLRGEYQEFSCAVADLKGVCHKKPRNETNQWVWGMEQKWSDKDIIFRKLSFPQNHLILAQYDIEFRQEVLSKQRIVDFMAF